MRRAPIGRYAGDEGPCSEALVDGATPSACRPSGPARRRGSVRFWVMEAVESGQDADGSGPTTAAYVRSLRTSAGLSVGEVAARAGVEKGWLEQFEDGTVDEGPNYDLLLRLIAATQPPRPDWWDSGHEHDLAAGRRSVEVPGRARPVVPRSASTR